jgi:hypothetical protein
MTTLPTPTSRTSLACVEDLASVSVRRAAVAVESAPARATGLRLQSTNSNPYGRGRSTN